MNKKNDLQNINNNTELEEKQKIQNNTKTEEKQKIQNSAKPKLKQKIQNNTKTEEKQKIQNSAKPKLKQKIQNNTTSEEKENIQNTTDKTDNRYDKGYKRIFSIKKNFLDFIKKYISLNWMMELTENDLELINKEFTTDQFDTYESDLIYKVNTKEGTIYLFFLLELQSYNDFTMPFRLLVYMIAIWVDYFKNCDKNVRKQKDFRLPAIMPIVLHNGEKNWTASRNFKEMIAHANVFGDYVVNFKYELVSINELTISKIKNSNTLIDNIFLADKKRTRKEWIDGIPELIRRIREMNKDDFNEWITWFFNVIKALNEEERNKLIEQLREGDEKDMCSSLEMLLNREKAEGKEEGKAEGKAEAVLELLEDIGEPSEILKNYVMKQTDLEVLRRWHKAAAKADSIKEFEQAIGLLSV